MLPHPSQLPGRPLHSDLTPCQLCRGGGPLHSHLRKILSLMPAHTGHHSKFPMVRQCEQEGPSVTSPQWVTSPPFHSGVYLNMIRVPGPQRSHGDGTQSCPIPPHPLSQKMDAEGAIQHPSVHILPSPPCL